MTSSEQSTGALPRADVTPTNVKEYGAVGNGTTNDTKALKNAFAHGGWVFVPASIGPYIVTSSLNVPSNTRVTIARGATIEAGGAISGHAILYIGPTVSNVLINGQGVLDGNKAHYPTGANFGIQVDGASNVTIRDITSREMPGTDKRGTNEGDGLYVGRNTTKDVVPNNILIENVTSTANVRQGMSITAGTNVRILSSTFSGTMGNNPGAGIDIEGNVAADTLNDIVISGNEIANNTIGIRASHGQANSKIIIEGNCLQTSHRTPKSLGIEVEIKNTTVRNNVADAVCSRMSQQ
jgi:hypothetical protein